MDLLYNTAWLCAAKRRKVHCSVEPDRLPSASASSSVGRLLLALALIGAIVGLIGYTASTIPDPQVIAPTIQPSHSGVSK